MNCQICGGATKFVLTKERNVSCGDYFEGKRLYPSDLGNVSLVECTVCGFGCFAEMHAWSKQTYRDDIYNDAYDLCDQPFREDRARKLSTWLVGALEPCDLIDFGGGEGRLAELLRESGFNALTYDPFYGGTQLPVGDADIVTAFEVVEHVPDQRNLFSLLKSLSRNDGLIVFSTLLKDAHPAGDWWYASPRNGHVCFHTADSLQRLMSELGLASTSLSRETHVAARRAECLSRAEAWGSVPVNEIPRYVFAHRWSHLASVDA